MGDAADHMEDVEINRYFLPKLERHLEKVARIEAVGSCEWQQKNGERILVRDMGAAHLENVVKLLERRQHPSAWKFREYFEHKKRQI